MITKQELNKIAQTTSLSLYQQEKDYFLKLFLNFYYKHYEDAIFKGGTALKYLYNIDRFSEDLDFNIQDIKKFKKQVHETIKRINELGITTKFQKEEEFKDSYTTTITVQGPLYTGTTQTQNKFRIDAGYRTGTLKNPEWKIIKSEYPQTKKQILTKVMHTQEILVEKILALMSRDKGRDLYYVWYLLTSNLELDKDLLHKKLGAAKSQEQSSRTAKIEQTKIDIKNICSKQTYERDMSKLSSRIIPYEQVKKQVIKALKYVL